MGEKIVSQCRCTVVEFDEAAPIKMKIGDTLVGHTFPTANDIVDVSKIAFRGFAIWSNCKRKCLKYRGCAKDLY